MAAVFKIKSGYIAPHFQMSELLINQFETFNFTVAQWNKIVLQAEMLEEFREEIGNKPLTVNSWLRGPKYNSVGDGKGHGGKGISTSNHLNGTATDISKSGISKATFIKYAKIWRDICKKHKVVGEAGRYSWGIHLGYQTYSNSFYHWDSTSGKQVNMPYKELK